MKLRLTSGNYKSIKALDWTNIPEFVVVTGSNGSGKTQLLELINHFIGVDPASRSKQGRDRNNPFYGVQLEVENFDANFDDVIFQPATWNLGNLGGINASSFSGTINNLHQHIIGAKANSSYAELGEIVREIIGKPAGDISLLDVQTNLPIDHFDYINRIQIHEGLSENFLAYHLHSAELRDQGKTQEDIDADLGPAPWSVINDLLADASFPYRVSQPVGFLGDFNFKLVGRDDENLIIDFSDLSAGEKILITMTI